MILAFSAYAVPFTSVRIGDIDRFGYEPNLDEALESASGSPAGTNTNGILEPNEFLPDLDGDGATNHVEGDDKDRRSTAERADTGGTIEWQRAHGYRNTWLKIY